MSDAALAAAAGIPTPVLSALRAVESGGSPSLIRFEPHVFLRHRPDLAREIPFTRSESGPSHVRAETNRDAFDHAYGLDRIAAVKATSWGTYQQLGSNLLALFDEDPARAISGFYADPTNVSKALLVHWMQTNPRAVRAANAGDWYEFVHRYNGCTDCTRYLSRFMPALEQASQATSTGLWVALGALAAIIIGAGAAYGGMSFGSRRKRRRRR